MNNFKDAKIRPTVDELSSVINTNYDKDKAQRILGIRDLMYAIRGCKSWEDVEVKTGVPAHLLKNRAKYYKRKGYKIKRMPMKNRK